MRSRGKGMRRASLLCFLTAAGTPAAAESAATAVVSRRLGHPGADGRLETKSCAATGAAPSCADWCNKDFLQMHCPDCACSACDFCQEVRSCEPLPNSDDTNVQQCEPFCSEMHKKQHCLRCSCQTCSFCPGKDRLADRDVSCHHGQCSDFCDPLFKREHCSECDCRECSL